MLRYVFCLFITVLLLTSCSNAAGRTPHTVTSGELLIASESAVVVKGSTTATISLINSSGIMNPLKVNITSSNPGVATISPTNCYLTSQNNSCSVSIIGVTAGSTSITASADGYSTPASITVTSSHVAYITDYSANTVSKCLITLNGTFGSCTNTGNGLNGPDGVVFNPTSDHAYIVDLSANTVSVCPVKADGSFATCTTTGNGFNGPAGIAFDPMGKNAYITNVFANAVSICPVNSDGTFSTCHTELFGQLSGPYAIAINPTGSYAYVDNSLSGDVTMCSINDDGTFGTCQKTGSGFNDSRGIILNPAGNYAYLTNSGFGNVSMCPINPDGTFASCQTAEFDHSNSPYGIAFNPNGTYAYLVNPSSNTVFVCSVNPDGTFTNCTSTGSEFNTPVGIVIR